MLGSSRAGWMFVRPKAAKMIIKYFRKCAVDAYYVMTSEKVSKEDAESNPEEFHVRTKATANYINNSILLSYIMNVCFNNEFNDLFDWDIVICKNDFNVKKVVFGNKEVSVVGALLRFNKERHDERNKAIDEIQQEIQKIQDRENKPAYQTQFKSSKDLHSPFVRNHPWLSSLALFGKSTIGDVAEKIYKRTLPTGVQNNFEEIERLLKDLEQLNIEQINMNIYENYSKVYDWICSQWKLDKVNPELNNDIINNTNSSFGGIGNNSDIERYNNRNRSLAIWNFMNPIDKSGRDKVVSFLNGHFGFMFEYADGEADIDDENGKNIAIVEPDCHFVALYNTLHRTSKGYRTTDEWEKYKFE